jgi:hypothetical protein
VGSGTPLDERGRGGKPTGNPMDTYIVKCACTFRVQTESADEARQRAVAQVTAAGAISVVVDEFVLRLSAQVPGESIDGTPR